MNIDKGELLTRKQYDMTFPSMDIVYKSKKRDAHNCEATVGVPALVLGIPAQNRTPDPDPWASTHDCVFFSSVDGYYDIVTTDPRARAEWASTVPARLNSAIGDGPLRIAYVLTATVTVTLGLPNDQSATALRSTEFVYCLQGMQKLRELYDMDASGKPGTRRVEVYPVHLYSDESFEVPAAQLAAEFSQVRQANQAVWPLGTANENVLTVISGTQSETKAKLRAMLGTVEMLFMDEGNTHWLLNRLLGSGCDNALVGFRGIVSGAGAGTNVCGMHTMLQVYKNTVGQAEHTFDAGLSTNAITNDTSVCKNVDTGACNFNGIEVTNRAHYCAFKSDDSAWIKAFYAIGEQQVAPYQASLPQVLANGEVLVGGTLLTGGNTQRRYPADGIVATLPRQIEAYTTNILAARVNFGALA